MWMPTQVILPPYVAVLLKPRSATAEFVGLLPGDLNNFADQTGFADDLFHRQIARLIAHRQHHAERDLLRSTASPHCAQTRFIDGERFLRHDVDFPFRRFDDCAGALAVIVRDGDDVELFLVEHLAPVRILFRRREFRLLLARAVPVGDNLHIGQAIERRENLARVTFESEDGDADFFGSRTGSAAAAKAAGASKMARRERSRI